MEEKYFITGANGHLGVNLVNRLLELGKKVRILILKGEEYYSFDPKVEVCYGNVLDKESLKNFLGHDDNTKAIVIHCAGIVSIASKFDQAVYDVNVVGTRNITDVAYDLKVDRFIYVSSVHAIKETENNGVIKEVSSFDSNLVEGLYAKTKAIASQYVLNKAQEGLNASIVHPSGIFGPNDYKGGHLTQMLIDYANGRLTAGVKGGYDFVDVRDVVEGIIACVTKGRSGQCYIFSNRYYTVKELFTIFSQVTNHKLIKTYLPMWFAKITAPIAEVYYKLLNQKPLYTSYSLYTLTSNANFSHEKASKELGYNPRDLQETIKDTYDWLLSIGRIKNK